MIVERSERGTSEAVSLHKCQKHSSLGVIRQRVGQLVLIRRLSVQGAESQGRTFTLLIFS